MAGSGSVQSGPGSTRLADGQDLQPHNTPGWSRTGAEYKPSIISSDRLAGVGGSGSVQSEPVHPILITPRVLQSDGMPSRRVLDLDTRGSIDEIISRLSIEGFGNNDQAEQWFKLMKHRQNLVEEKVDKMSEGMNTFSMAIQEAKVILHTLQEDIDILKPNSSKVWERLKIDEQRLFKLESNVDKLDSKLDERVENRDNG